MSLIIAKILIVKGQFIIVNFPMIFLALIIKNDFFDNWV